ncbi:5-oxoprolinase subunit PxpB [Paenibacillus mendelii]|uniref:5-oxoprolinase subunit PxpB n=1 Tax=Paenibacillus mendelii TaxID=206163 RepID=A0ABV6J8P9_9BACL|nr:5-oxoprolinase subunit PxpB [Paenibacillus mendelii]
MPPQIAIEPLGDRALVVKRVEVSDHSDTKAMADMAELLRAAEASWLIDIIPAMDTLTVVYDPLAILQRVSDGLMVSNAGEAIAEDRRTMRRSGAEAGIGDGWGSPYVAAELEIRRLLAAAAGNRTLKPRTVEVPVHYGGIDGPDLQQAAKRSGLSEEAFIELHTSVEYEVAMIGFMPGFPYLTGLPRELFQPRLISPRHRVPAGSVGIGGGQTGVYPLETPGGWRLIGRTQVRLFDPARNEPSLLRAGDKLRFVRIDRRDLEAEEDMS